MRSAEAHHGSQAPAGDVTRHYEKCPPPGYRQLVGGPARSPKDYQKVTSYRDDPKKKWEHEPRPYDQRIGPYSSLEVKELEIDPETGSPLHPLLQLHDLSEANGDLGAGGRGDLPHEGPLRAADYCMTRHNPETGELEFLLLDRGKDDRGVPRPMPEDGVEADPATVAWAFPGGGEEPEEGGNDEDPKSAEENGKIVAIRELGEETDVESDPDGQHGPPLDLHAAERVFAGCANDPRDRRNVWIETQAYHLHLSPDQAAALHVPEGPRQGVSEPGEPPEVRQVKWVPYSQIHKMYAGHKRIADHIAYRVAEAARR